MILCPEARRAVDEAPILRGEVHRKLDATTRIATLIAPPGYGKTTTLRQWLDAPLGPAVPTAFIPVGNIDGGALSFWRLFLVQLDEALPGIDPELVTLLADPAHDHDVLGALVSWIERANVQANVILDDLPRIEDRSVLDGLALLVERVGDRVRLIVSGRGEPALPLAGWRSRGWVTHVGVDDLSFNDADARHLARSMGSPLDDAEVAVLNRTVEGWPLGVHLGLLAATEPTDALAGLHRRVRDHVVAEVVDLLPEHQRHVAYALSVPAAFDLELSRLLLGDESVPVVRELLRLGIFLRIDDEQHGVMRYHGLVRGVLERELREREPVWHEQLVRRVVSISVERGDLAAAHAHLVSIADVGAAMRLVVSRAFSFVDRGDAEAVGRLALAFPPRSDVADPSLALDMSTLSFFAAQRDESWEWCTLAGQLVEPNDRHNLLRLHAMRALLALMDGALDDVDENLHGVAVAATDTASPDDPLTKWTSLTETRLALVTGRLDEAAIALDHARGMGAPPTVSEVTVPALAAWLHLERGDLAGALALADAACVWAEAEDVRYHHGVLEALVVLGHCRLAAGDVAAARELARRSHAYAATLGYAWDVIRAGTLDAEVQRLGAGSAASLEVVARLRAELAGGATSLVTEHLDRAEAAALVDAGDLNAARSVVARLPRGTWRSLLEARHAAVADDRRGVAAAVARGSSWPTALRLEAEVLMATTGSPRPQALRAALREGAAGGWVAPFLPHMTRIRQLLDGPSIVHEHPVLVVAAAGLRRGSVTAADPPPFTALTAREQSLLEFLPSHLSYAQIAARTFLSVNTVKSNLKSIYRKLGVASRAEAVELARDAGLI